MSAAPVYDGTTHIPDSVLDDEIDPTILALAKRLNDKVKGRVLTPYRKELLARLQAPNQNALPPMQYQSYRLIHGQHNHFTKEDVAECEKLNKSRPGREPTSPRETIFGPGATFTPQSDGEALMVDQDPTKYQPIGVVVGTDQAGSAELLAEINRMKARVAEKDAQMAEMSRMIAELQAGKGGKGK